MKFWTKAKEVDRKFGREMDTLKDTAISAMRNGQAAPAREILGMLQRVQPLGVDRILVSSAARRICFTLRRRMA